MSLLTPFAEKLLKAAQSVRAATPQQARRHTDVEPAIEALLKKGHNLAWITDWVLRQTAKTNEPLPAVKSTDWTRIYGVVRRVRDRLAKNIDAMTSSSDHTAMSCLASQPKRRKKP